MIIARLIGRAIRRFFAMLLFFVIRSRRPLAIITAVLVVGYFAMPQIGRSLPAGSLPGIFPVGGSGSSAASAKDVRTTKLGTVNAETAAAVQSYIKGLTQFDANLMWSSLAEEAINSMKQRGGSLETLQTGLDDAKKRGARYEDITMVGAYPLQGGGKYEFYVLSRRGFSGPDQLEQVFFVFTLNRDGKITRID